MAGLADTYKQMISEKKVEMKDWEGSKPDKDLDKASGEKEGTEADEKEDKEAVDCLNKIEKKNKKKVDESEQLSEISKKTLGQYVKASASDRQIRAWDLGADKKKDWVGAWKKQIKREKYHNKAVDRLTKESTEELNEISKKVLGSYIKKAHSQAFNRGEEAGEAQGDLGTWPYEKQNKRQKYVGKAVKRLISPSKKKLKESVDLLSLILDKKPIEFVEAFHESMKVRMQEPLDQWRDEIAQNLFLDINESDEPEAPKRTRLPHTHSYDGPSGESHDLKQGDTVRVLDTKRDAVTKHKVTVKGKTHWIRAGWLKPLNEEEQLSELSNKTLRSYISKAADDVADKKKTIFTAKFKPKGVKKKDYDSNVHKYENRMKGISKAFDKAKD